MKIKARINNITFDIKGDVILTLTSKERSEILKEYETLKDDEISVEIKKYRMK